MENQDVTRVCQVCGQELDISQFHKTAWGVTHTCKACVRKKRQENKDKGKLLEEAEKRVQEAINAKLKDIPTRDLMAELYRRGFDGTLSYIHTEKRTIDISKIR